MFILSPSGIKWLESELQDKVVVSPLTAIIKFAAPFEQHLLSEWVEPIDRTKLNPLPNRETIMQLYDMIQLTVCINRVCDMEKLKKLLTDYCDYRDGILSDPDFTYGDYLLMNASLLISCTTYLELYNSGSPVETMMSLEELKEIEHQLFDNAIFYYHRCSVISHGISSISGCMILAFYADAISLSRAAFLIGSTAVRQAQQIGLHREESYRGLSTAERSIRLKIWWTNYIFDRETCLRWGHSPVINDDDVSAPPLPGMDAFWSFNQKGPIKTRDKMIYRIQAVLDGLTDLNNFIDLELYVNADYAFIISDVYKSLLSSNSIKDNSVEHIITKRDQLFKDLESWRMSLPEKFRPRDEYTADFEQSVDELKNEPCCSNVYWIILITSFNIRYHHLRMIISRTTSQYLYELHDYRPRDENDLAIFQIGLESARSVLKVSSMIDKRFGSYANYLIFYPFNAFMTICAFYIYKFNATTSETAIRDMELLMKSLTSYFNPFSDDPRRNEKGWLFAAVAKCMLFITIESIKKSGVNLDFPSEFVIQCETNFEPIKAFLENDIKIEDLILTVRNKIQLLEIRHRKFAHLPVRRPSAADKDVDYTTGGVNVQQHQQQQQAQQQAYASEFNSTTPQLQDFTVASILNGDTNAIAGLGTPSEYNNEFNMNGAEVFFQSMLNVPNYMMDLGSYQV